MTEIVVELGEREDLQQQVIEAAARQMLTNWTMGDGERDEGYTVPSALRRSLEDAIREEVREQAAVAARGLVEKLLARKVRLTDSWGYDSGEKPVEEIVLDRLKAAVQSNRNGKSVLQEIIHEQVTGRLRAELTAVVEEARQPILDAMRAEATGLLERALRKAVA